MVMPSHHRSVVRSMLGFVFVASLLIGFGTSSRSTALADDAAEIISRYQDFENSLRSWRYDFTINYIDFGHGAMESPGCVFTAARSGIRTAVFSDPEFEYGTKRLRLWQSWDGRQSAVLGFFPFDTSLVNFVEYTSSPEVAYSDFFPASLALGWEMRGQLNMTLSGTRLISLLQQADTKATRRESMSFTYGPRSLKEFSAVRWPVHRFVPPAIADQPALEHTVTVYFDTEQDLLPRLWCVLPTGYAPGDQLPVGAQPFVVFTERFIDVDDPVLKRPRKFPQIVVYGGTLYEIASVEVNHSIEDGLLKPKITNGAKLIYNPGSRKQLVTYAGENGEAIHADLVDRQRVFSGLAVPELADDITASVSAKPEASRSLPRLVVLGSMVLLIISVVMRVRAARA
jgi:hypothetical protein